MRFALTPRFNPFWRDLDELFRDLSPTQTAVTTQAFQPTTDVVETEKSFELRVELPGFTPEQIDVKLEGAQLTITADRTEEKLEEGKTWVRRERNYGRFVRTFSLPETVEGTPPQAGYKNGVLTVTLPKKVETAPRTFKVKVEA